MNIAQELPQSLAAGIGAILLSIGAVNNDNYYLMFLVAGIIGALVILPIKKVR